jgi:CubicO group peptidase (beta-lactamase class C family)
MLKPLFAAALLLAPLQPAEAAPSPASLKAALDARAPAILKDANVPSFAVAYIVDGKLAWTAAYGEQSPGKPATPETLYNVASLTKPIAAETIMRLAAAGKIDLDEAMASHWVDPDVAANPWHKLLTPRIALSHRTGFTNWRYQTQGKLTFERQPGTKAGYSGEGYDYVARFAEKKLGKPFDILVQEQVFDPIGMKSSSLVTRPWFEGRVAMAQDKEGNLKQPDMFPTWSAADNLFTTPGDYARFLIAAMENRALTPALAIERLKVEENLAENDCPPPLTAKNLCPKSVGFGLGWMVFDNGIEQVIGHSGSDWGEQTYAFFVPARKLGVVVFSAGANGEKVTRDVVGLLYDNPHFNALLELQASN